MSIRIEPEEVRGLANQYRTQAGQVANINSAMDTLLGQLQGVWEGSASAAYAARFEELRPGFQKVEALIEEIASGLDASALTLEGADAAVASQWNSQ